MIDALTIAQYTFRRIFHRLKNFLDLLTELWEKIKLKLKLLKILLLKFPTVMSA